MSKLTFFVVGYCPQGRAQRSSQPFFISIFENYSSRMFNMISIEAFTKSNFFVPLSLPNFKSSEIMNVCERMLSIELQPRAPNSINSWIDDNELEYQPYLL